jgi:hypothetical protein
MSINKILYHYTSQSGVLGIINDKCIWATDILFQNDSSEFEYGKTMFIAIVKKKLEARYGKISEEILNGINENMLFLENPVFTISFSEDSDSLNQFRSYSNSVPGYSIGFDVLAIKKGLSGKFQVSFEKCLYDKKEQTDLINRIVDDIIDRSGNDDIISNSLMEILAGKIIKYSTMLKHPSFKDEKEWRLIFDYLNPIREFYRFRTGPSYMTPYITVPIDITKTIKKIIIGPTPNMSLAFRSVVDICYDKKLLGGQYYEFIKKSKTPYRKW